MNKDLERRMAVLEEVVRRRFGVEGSNDRERRMAILENLYLFPAKYFIIPDT